MNTITIPIYDKQLLRVVLQMSKSTFTRYMNEIEIEPEFIRLFPKYKRLNSRLPDDIFIWIFTDYGITRETAVSRIMNHFGIEKKPEDLEKFTSMLGLKGTSFSLESVQIGSYQSK